MPYFVVASTATGAVLRACWSTVTDTAELEAWAGAGETVIFTDPPLEVPADWRVVDGTLVERTTMVPRISATTIAPDGVDACTISDLPDPCTVAVLGAGNVPPTTVSGGSLTLTATEPGVIRVLVFAEPVYKPWETTIHAV